MKTAIVAIGGNALLPAKDSGTAEGQRKRIRETCRHLAAVIQKGWDIALVHGNGPQVGNILLQNEAAQATVPALPLDICVAESQAQIGYMLQQELSNELAARGIRKNVVSIVTQVVVDENDPAMQNPTKPIGPYYDRERAEELKRARGWTLVYDRRGGYRRVVPSPKPIDIVEKATIERLMFTGTTDWVVIAAGGGGVPVIRKNGELIGIEAVIDKDLAAAVLAKVVKEKLFVMLTDVAHVAVNFGKVEQTNIGRMTVAEARHYMAQGHFPPGSMGPKVEAAIEFLDGGGERVIITNPDNFERALEGVAGTTITP
jgi:carbamate kinase